MALLKRVIGFGPNWTVQPKKKKKKKGETKNGEGRWPSAMQRGAMPTWTGWSEQRVSKNGSDGVRWNCCQLREGVHEWERGGNVVAGFGNDMGGSKNDREGVMGGGGLG